MTGFPEFQARQIVQKMHRLTGQVDAFTNHARMLRLSSTSIDARLLLQEADTLLRGLMASRTDFEKANAQIGSVSRALSSKPTAGGANPAAQWGNEFRAGSRQFIVSVQGAEQELKHLYGEASNQMNIPTRTGTAPDSLWDALMVMTDIVARSIEALKRPKN